MKGGRKRTFFVLRHLSCVTQVLLQCRKYIFQGRLMSADWPRNFKRELFIWLHSILWMSFINDGIGENADNPDACRLDSQTHLGCCPSLSTSGFHFSMFWASFPLHANSTWGHHNTVKVVFVRWLFHLWHFCLSAAAGRTDSLLTSQNETQYFGSLSVPGQYSSTPACVVLSSVTHSWPVFPHWPDAASGWEGHGRSV